METVIRYLKSKTLWGILIMLLAQWFGNQGIVITDAENEALVNLGENLGTVLGTALAIYGRINARGPLGTRYPKKLNDGGSIVLVVLALLMLTGCAGQRFSVAEAALLGCRSYAGTLDALAGMREQHLLTEQQVAAVNLVRPPIEAVCLGPEIPLDADTADLVATGMRALLAIELEGRGL